MSIRSGRERLLQTLCCEVGGMLVASPIHSLTFSVDLETSLALFSTLAVSIVAWSCAHNAIYDAVEWRLFRQLASDRSIRSRLLHAVSHEGTTILFSLPMIMHLGGHSLMEALVLDLSLTLIDVGYTYAFHVAYDRLRPVRKTAPRPVRSRPPTVDGRSRHYSSGDLPYIVRARLRSVE